MNKYTKKSIQEVESKEEFAALLEKFRVSDAPFEVKQEAIEYLKNKKREFDVEKLPVREDALKQIKDGEADISDIIGGL